MTAREKIKKLQTMNVNVFKLDGNIGVLVRGNSLSNEIFENHLNCGDIAFIPVHELPDNISNIEFTSTYTDTYSRYLETSEITEINCGYMINIENEERIVMVWETQELLNENQIIMDYCIYTHRGYMWTSRLADFSDTISEDLREMYSESERNSYIDRVKKEWENETKKYRKKVAGVATFDDVIYYATM